MVQVEFAFFQNDWYRRCLKIQIVLDWECTYYVPSTVRVGLSVKVTYISPTLHSLMVIYTP